MWVRIASGRRARRRSQRCFKLPAPVRPCDTPGGAHVCQAGGGGGGGTRGINRGSVMRRGVAAT